MKFNKWTLGLAAVGVVSLTSAARADETNMVKTALSSTTISCYVDVSAQFNPNGGGGAFGQPAAPNYTYGNKANGVNLISREAGKETLRGNMYEVAVNCKWEGKLESLTRFLFDLQKEDVILDVSELTISPNEKKVLRGGFTVYCSYSRIPPPGGEKKTETKGPKNDVLSP